MKLFVASFLSLFLSSCALFGARPTIPDHKAVSTAVESTVILLWASWQKDDFAVACAGEFIAPRVLVTSEHCIAPATDCPIDDDVCFKATRVGYLTHSQYENADSGVEASIGHVGAIRKDYDLALIVTERASTDFVEISVLPPLPGDYVYSVGHPGGAVFTISTGFVLLPYKAAPEPSVETAIFVDHGSSGGGLYNTFGQLIGVTHSGSENKRTSLSTLGYAVAEMFVQLEAGG
jgi:S1-C subfamily serine protease